jgi:hypothetical protein
MDIVIDGLFARALLGLAVGLLLGKLAAHWVLATPALRRRPEPQPWPPGLLVTDAAGNLGAVVAAGSRWVVVRAPDGTKCRVRRPTLVPSGWRDAVRYVEACGGQ